MKSLYRFLYALGVGFIGGLIFDFLSFPLPWLLGALSATLIASLAGAQFEVSKPIRKYIAIIIGLMLGSTFTPEILNRVDEWIPTLTAAVFYIFVITAIAQFYCRKVLKMDSVTALFSGLPGGLSEMTLLGEEAGADIKLLTLTHACRVASVLLFIPFILTYLFNMGETEPQTTVSYWNSTEIGILLIGGLCGAYIAGLLRIPANKIVGPLVISGGLHLGGFITSEPHELISISIQLVLGSALGARFFGTSVRSMGKVMLLATTMTFAMLSVTFVTAYFVSQVTDVSFAAMVLALSPGGFAEMALTALSLGIDPAFVTTHHAARLFVIVFMTPLIIKFFFMRKK